MGSMQVWALGAAICFACGMAQAMVVQELAEQDAKKVEEIIEERQSMMFNQREQAERSKEARMAMLRKLESLRGTDTPPVSSATAAPAAIPSAPRALEVGWREGTLGGAVLVVLALAGLVTWQIRKETLAYRARKARQAEQMARLEAKRTSQRANT